MAVSNIYYLLLFYFSLLISSHTHSIKHTQHSNHLPIYQTKSSFNQSFQIAQIFQNEGFYHLRRYWPSRSLRSSRSCTHSGSSQSSSGILGANYLLRGWWCQLHRVSSYQWHSVHHQYVSWTSPLLSCISYTLIILFVTLEELWCVREVFLTAALHSDNDLSVSSIYSPSVAFCTFFGAEGSSTVVTADQTAYVSPPQPQVSGICQI